MAPSDRDRPKKSWREMDAQRDRNGPRPPRNNEAPGERRNSDGSMDARASKQYRAALDALFAKGEVGKLAEKLTGGPGGGRANAVDLVTGKTPAPPPAPIAAPQAAEPAPTRAPAAPPAPAKEKDPKDEARATLRKKVVESLGRDDISRAVDRYVKAHGWPSDFEVLEQALEHNKEPRQAEAMDALDKLLAKEKPKRSRTLAGKLRFIEETSDSPELREQAAKIRGKL